MKNVYLSDEIKGWLLQSDSGILSPSEAAEWREKARIMEMALRSLASARSVTTEGQSYSAIAKKALEEIVCHS